MPTAHMISLLLSTPRWLFSRLSKPRWWKRCPLCEIKRWGVQEKVAYAFWNFDQSASKHIDIMKLALNMIDVCWWVLRGQSAPKQMQYGSCLIGQWNICIFLLLTRGWLYYINMRWERPCEARWCDYINDCMHPYAYGILQVHTLHLLAIICLLHNLVLLVHGNCITCYRNM